MLEAHLSQGTAAGEPNVATERQVGTTEAVTPASCRTLVVRRHTSDDSVGDMSDDPILRRLAAAAGPHGGLVDRAILARLGIGPSHERSLIQRAALTEALPAVFLVGGADWLTHDQLLHAAVLAVGWDGRLAGQSALEIHGATSATPGEAHVTRARPTPRRRQRITSLVPVLELEAPGVVTIDTPRNPGAREVVRTWPVEPLARSLRQLAVDADTSVLTRAWREADFLGLLQESAIRDELGRGRPGSKALRTLLAAQPPRNAGDSFRSRAEYLLLEALLARGVPRPRVNALTQFGERLIETDLYFPEAALIAEVDGPQHDSPARKAVDEERDCYLANLGIETIRHTDAAVRANADACAARIDHRRTARLAELRTATNTTRRSVAK